MQTVAQVAQRDIALLLFEQHTHLDVAGPAEVFAIANAHLATGIGSYRLCTYAPGGRRCVRSESGLVLRPDATLPHSLAVDTLIVPGGRGLREPKVLSRIAALLRASSANCRRVVSVCTGAYALAASGLLNGLEISTHWAFAADLQQHYPNVQVRADALYCRSGRFASSAGISAGIDLCLALVEEDHGVRVAQAVARELVVYLRRHGGQAQYSELLRLQDGPRDRLAALVDWMLGNPRATLTVDALAERANWSPRQLQRQVTARFGHGVAELVERVRLAAAQALLAGTAMPMAQVASAVGYASADAFGRAFRQKLALAPTVWRARFGVMPRAP